MFELEIKYKLIKKFPQYIIEIMEMNNKELVKFINQLKTIENEWK